MGGKSRKSGGVSRRLIDRIKQGAYSEPAKTKKKGATVEPKDRGLLGLLPTEK